MFIVDLIAPVSVPSVNAFPYLLEIPGIFTNAAPYVPKWVSVSVAIIASVPRTLLRIANPRSSSFIATKAS